MPGELSRRLVWKFARVAPALTAGVAAPVRNRPVADIPWRDVRRIAMRNCGQPWQAGHPFWTGGRSSVSGRAVRSAPGCPRTALPPDPSRQQAGRDRAMVAKGEEMHEQHELEAQLQTATEALQKAVM